MKGERLNIPNLRKSAEELDRMREKSITLAHERWPLYDADIRSFAKEFRQVIPGGEKARTEKESVRVFVDYIRTILQPEQNRHLTALEFGGPGVRIFQGFPKGFFEKTYGVCLDDTSNSIKKKPRSTHEIIRGNIFHKETYSKIDAALYGDGVDLILSRMYGGLDEVTHDPIIWARVARTWYKLLHEGGLMFVQYRLSTADRWISETEIQKDVREKLMTEWVDFIKEHFSDVLDIQLDDFAFRLYRKIGAPEELPILKDFDGTRIIEKRPEDPRPF